MLSMSDSGRWQNPRWAVYEKRLLATQNGRGVKWGSANTTTLFQAPIRGCKAGIIVWFMPSSNSWGSLKEGGRWGSLVWFVGVGLNNSGDWAWSCWELVLIHVLKEVWILVELVGEGGSWPLGESGVGAKVRLEVELNSRGEVLLLTDWAIPFNKGTPLWMIFQCLSQGVLTC